MIRHALSTGVRSFSPIIFRNCRTLRRFSLRSFDDFNQPRCLVSGAKKRFSSLTNEWSDEQFQSVVNGNKLVVFMKGTPEGPQCGFSKYVIQILHMHGCTDFMTLNVLEDEILRSRVKEFSNWPTIPQVYMDGEFVGGFDILLQLHQSGELIEEFEKIGHRSALLDVDKKEE